MEFLLFSILVSIRLFSNVKEFDRIEVGGSNIVEVVHGSIYFKDKKRDSLYFPEAGRIRIFSKGKKVKERRYRGSLVIKKVKKEVVVINCLSLEEYLYGVVGGEMPKAGIEALKAQAVVSRTFAIKNLKRHGEYDFCDLTHCQNYKGMESETEASIRAVEETKGEVLFYKGELCDVFYHSTCGGKTAESSSIWEKKKKPYLVSVDDADNCKNSPFYHWKLSISKKDLEDILKIEGIKNIKTEENEDGRVRSVIIEGRDRKRRIKGWDFRMLICKKLGWSSLKSSAFNVKVERDRVVFYGRGLGHGVGLCQWGAKGLADKGYTYQEILKHYFPNTEVKRWKF